MATSLAAEPGPFAEVVFDGITEAIYPVPFIGYLNGPAVSVLAGQRVELGQSHGLLLGGRGHFNTRWPAVAAQAGARTTFDLQGLVGWAPRLGRWLFRVGVQAGARVGVVSGQHTFYQGTVAGPSPEWSARFASEAFLGVSFQVVEHLAITAIINLPITSFYADMIDMDTPLWGLGATWLF